MAVTERNVAVMGSGSWGTAVAKVMADAGCEVTQWARRPDVVTAINDTHQNPDYLPGVELPPNLRATTEPAEALTGVTTVILGVPAQTMRTKVRCY
jgi:glycerol-3-phosphate dehydrogenase (NAD(P)+)